MTKFHKDLLKSILFALLFGELTQDEIVQAQVIVSSSQNQPIWLRALAGGNPNAPEQLRAFVAEELCRQQLQDLGYTVHLTKTDSSDPSPLEGGPRGVGLGDGNNHQEQTS